MAYPVGGMWLAECLELTLMARGESPAEALSSLRDQIVAYMHAVVERGWEGSLIRVRLRCVTGSRCTCGSRWRGCGGVGLCSCPRRTTLTSRVAKTLATADVRRIEDCLRALGCELDRREASHQVWVDPTRRRVGVDDVKWNPVSGPTLKHLFEEQLGLTREQFYRATKRTGKKI